MEGRRWVLNVSRLHQILHNSRRRLPVNGPTQGYADFEHYCPSVRVIFSCLSFSPYMIYAHAHAHAHRFTFLFILLPLHRAFGDCVVFVTLDAV